MNKMELVKVIATSADITQTQANAVISAIVKAVTTTLVKNEKLTLVGFGTFEVVERATRIGRNPSTGAELQIPATRLPKFKAGKTLKEAVANLSRSIVKETVKTQVKQEQKPLKLKTKKGTK